MDAAVGSSSQHDARMISMEDHLAFAEIARKHAGISLGTHKRQLLSSRLQKRMRALGIARYGDYRRYLLDNMAAELGEFINVITTNLTAFFRENHHFEFLRRHLDSAPAGVPIRIWSAGCSTGEEPYSIAMVVNESTARSRRIAVEITATDIDTQCLARAESGVYELAGAKGLDRDRLAAHFLRGVGANDGKIRVRSQVRELVEFRHLNLLEGWELTLPVDIVFCRNVVIYFDNDTQKALFHRLAEALVPGGLMIIGHSENLQRVSDRFESLGHTIYRRIK